MPTTYPNLRALARSCIETTRSLDDAALAFAATLLGAGITKAPDGRRLSIDYARGFIANIQLLSIHNL
jgi:hypothetical protein